MKRLVFIVGLLAISVVTKAQTFHDFMQIPLGTGILVHADYGYYFDELPNDPSNASFHIMFFERQGVYIIRTDENLQNGVNDDENEDHVFNVTHISSGLFKRNGKHIIMKDTATSLKMKAKIENDSLVFVKAYKLLMDKKFAQSPERMLFAHKGTVLSDCNRLLKMIREGRWKTNWSVSPGNYGSWIGNLHLDKDGTFVFSDDEWPFRLLKGTWTQKDSLIILHDEYTDHDYYLIYEAPNLRTMLLPGDWHIEGTVLTPQTDDNLLLNETEGIRY